MDFKAQSTPVTLIGDSTKASKPSFFQKIRSPFSKISPDFKKPAAIGLTVLMMFALALGVYLTRKPTQLAPQAAVDGIDITLKPSTINTQAGQDFQVDVFLDTAQTTYKITAAQVKVNYDPAILELKTNTIGTFLPVTIVEPVNVSGSSSFTVGVNVNGQKQGSGTIATLTFKAKVATATQVTLDSTQTIVTAYENTGNFARGLTPTSVTFNAVGSPSPSPAGTTPETSFTLEKPTAVAIPPGQEFSVKVLSRSDIDNSNLWNATITFPKDLIEVVRFDKTGSFITSWTEEFFSNTSGEVSLTGGVTSPGFKTNLNNALMTTIVFRAKAVGAANINLIDPTNIYRNSDNTRILQTKRNTTIQIDSQPASPSPSPSASPSSAACTTTATSKNSVVNSSTSVTWTYVYPASTKITAINFPAKAGVKFTVNGQTSAVGGALNVNLGQGSSTIQFTITPTTACSAFTAPFTMTNSCGATISDFAGMGSASAYGSVCQASPSPSPSPQPSYLFCNTSAQTSGCPTGYVCQSYCPAGHLGDCSLTAGRCALPSASPSPSPSPLSKGDGNNDGKVDLQDLSIMFSKWSPAINIISHFRLDFDDNRRINSFDYSEMKALLIQLNIVRQ